SVARSSPHSLHMGHCPAAICSALSVMASPPKQPKPAQPKTGKQPNRPPSREQPPAAQTQPRLRGSRGSWLGLGAGAEGGHNVCNLGLVVMSSFAIDARLIAKILASVSLHDPRTD